MGSVCWGLLEVVAAGCGPVVKLWAPSEPQQAIKINEGTPVYGLDFSSNNRVLAVAGEKGQAVLYSGKGAAVNTGCSPVGLMPRNPEENTDSITCIKFAPDDTNLIGGCRNGRVHIWSLKDEGTYTLDPLSGSITSVAVSTAALGNPVLAASSSSGRVVLCEYPKGRKLKTLLSSGHRANCLGFAPSQPSLLCGGRGSGQLLVWDITAVSDVQEYNVHRAIVTGCTFVPNNNSLLVSCGEDGVLACTDRRTGQVAWESQLRQSLSSLSMRWDGTQVAVGTGNGRVLVHDMRRVSTTLAAQEFSDELPVTALRWQNMPHASSKSKRASLGAGAAAAAAASSGSAAPSSRSLAATSSAAPGSSSSLAAAGGSRAAQAAAAAAGKGAAAAPQQPHKTPLVVPGFDSNTPRSGTSSADAEYGLRVMSPMRAFSPVDSDINSAATAATAGAAAGGAALHTPEAGLASATPADSSASAGGYKGPAMFTPGLPYMANLGAAATTPFGVAAADATPVSRLADSAAAAGGRGVGPTVPPSAAAADGSRGVPRSPRGSAGGAAAPAGAGASLKAAAAAAAGTAAGAGRGAPDAAATAAKGSKSPRAAGTKSSSVAAAGSAAAAPGGVSSHRRKPSDGTAAAAAGSRSRPGTAPDSSNLPDKGAAAADGFVSAPGRAAAAAAGAAAGKAGLGAAAGQQQQAGSGQPQMADAAAAAASAGGGAGSSSFGPAAAAGAGAAAGSGGVVLGVTGSALREDVFKAYIDGRMDALQEAVAAIRVDLHQRFDQQQADFAAVLNSLAARQDQLAEAVTQLAEAVQNLNTAKQQQQQQQQHPVCGVSVIPWI